MLDAVSTGLHPSAVVGQLAGKYGVSERCLWSDWQRRAKWVPVLLGLEKFAGFGEMVVERLNAVQKAAWSIYLKASNDNARVGALRTVLDASSLVMQAFVRLFAYFLWVVLLESAWNIPIITRRKPATLKASMMTWLKMTEPERVVPPNNPEKSAY